ncbi:MAG: DUF3098 domain-containing protein [Bacteroidota bacterium]
MVQKKKVNIPNKPVIRKTAETATPQVKAAEPVKPVYQRQRTEVKKPVFLFGRINYILMLSGLLVMAIGFILMIGGGSKDPNVFNPDIFDAQRLTVAPILVLLGYAIEIFAIMIRPKDKVQA